MINERNTNDSRSLPQPSGQDNIFGAWGWVTGWMIVGDDASGRRNSNERPKYFAWEHFDGHN